MSESMTEQIALLLAACIALSVIVLGHVLTKLVRTVIDKGVRDGWRTPSPVGEQRVRAQRVEPGRSVGDERAGLTREPAREEPAGPARPPGFSATLVAPDVQRGGIEVKSRQSKLERGARWTGEEAGQGAAHEGSVDHGTTAYREVGDEVTAVLAAAEHAAAQILSKAEEQARRIRVEAEKKGAEVEAEASRRRDALTKGAEAMEARIESMLTTFRGMVTELDELLPAERRSGADKPEPLAAEGLDEALKAAASHRQLSSHAD
jgi:hypothetical protein